METRKALPLTVYDSTPLNHCLNIILMATNNNKALQILRES